MKIIKSLVRWFAEYQHNRLIRKTVHLSAEAMLTLAEQQFSEALTKEERERLVSAYGKWLVAGGDERLLGMVDQPVRTLHLFLGEVIR